MNKKIKKQPANAHRNAIPWNSSAKKQLANDAHQNAIPWNSSAGIPNLHKLENNIQTTPRVKRVKITPRKKASPRAQGLFLILFTNRKIPDIRGKEKGMYIEGQNQYSIK